MEPGTAEEDWTAPVGNVGTIEVADSIQMPKAKHGWQQQQEHHAAGDSGGVEAEKQNRAIFHADDQMSGLQLRQATSQPENQHEPKQEAQKMDDQSSKGNIAS